MQVCVESTKRNVHYFNAQQSAVAKGQLVNTDSCSTHRTEALQYNNKRVALTKEDVKGVCLGGKKKYAENNGMYFS